MEVIILAGGRGTRLANVLSDRPKPMADIAGRPFLEYLLDYFATQYIRTVVLSVGYLADVIQDHFGSGYKGMRILYATEHVALGTGGAIKNALQFTRDRDVFVANGDTFVELDYVSMMAAHRKRAAKFTVAVHPVADVARYGSIETDNHGIIFSFGEKLSTGNGVINSGVYLLRRSLLNSYALPDRFSIEADFIRTYLSELQPSAFLSNGYFIDIGIPADLERARQELPLRCKR